MSESPAKNSTDTRRRIRNLAEYCIARGVIGVLSLLPMPVASFVGECLGTCLRVFLAKFRKRAYAHAELVLGLTGPQADDFVRKNFHHYGKVIAEVAVISRCSMERFLSFIDLGDLRDITQTLLREKKGILFLTPHYGNWELCNKLGVAAGVTGGSIARPLENHILNEYIRSLREYNGLAILDKEGAIRKAMRILRDNGAVGILMDQDGGKFGYISTFLGKPASTLTVPAELAIRLGSPIITIALRRNPAGSPKRFTVVHGPVRHADSATQSKEAIGRLTDTFNQDLGDIILRDPTQWLWVHRRWKHWESMEK